MNVYLIIVGLERVETVKTEILFVDIHVYLMFRSRRPTEWYVLWATRLPKVHNSMQE
jgi:hypothetical protein